MGEKKKVYTDAKTKWSKLLAKSENTKPSTKKSTYASKSNKTNNPSQLSQIENKLAILKKEIGANLEKDKNVEAAAKKMEKMEKLQKKQRKKILEGEQIEFDHFCRASRKYLISNVYYGEIEKRNKSNLKQQRALWKQQNKENAELHSQKLLFEID